LSAAKRKTGWRSKADKHERRYLGPVVIGVGRGWMVAREHLAEQRGLIILPFVAIALPVTSGHSV
jgi:hypothetical protein